MGYDIRKVNLRPRAKYVYKDPAPIFSKQFYMYAGSIVAICLILFFVMEKCSCR